MARRLVSGAVLGVILLPACTAVLGMEEATLDQQTAPLTCERTPREPTVDCANPNCEKCLSGCEDVTADIGECLQKSSCRKALMNYRSCAGNDCAAGSECGGCLEDMREPAAIKLGRCYEQCDGCGPADIVSFCDLYCACMQTNCPANRPSDCLAACKARQTNADGPEAHIEDWRTHCFWWHCEAATTVDDGFHCKHAVDPLVMCGLSRYPAADSTNVPCKFPKAFKNGACNTNNDCCSGRCLIDTGACD